MTNDGNVNVNNVVVSDTLPGLGPISCTPLAGASLAPDQSMSCTATYTVTLADVNAGEITNNAKATATNPQGGALKTPIPRQ